MSGGGKGGSQTTTQSLPPWLDAAAQRNIARAEEISQIGYTPYGGPEVAAFTGQQLGAMNNRNDMANAYGLSGGTINVPEPEMYANGMQGYSSLPLYNEARKHLKEYRPGQYEAITDQFISPRSGANPNSLPAATTATLDNALSEWEASQMGDTDHGGGNPTGNFGGFGGIGGRAGDIAGLNGDFGNAFGGGGIGGVSPEGGSGGGFGGSK